MKRFVLAAATIAATTTTGFAGGVDRSGQDISILFEEGNHVKLTFATANPDVPGTGAGPAAVYTNTQSAVSFNSFSLAIKKQMSEKLSFAVIMDEPYGADIRYTDGLLGGLGNLVAAGAGLPAGHPVHTALTSDPNGRALVDSKALTALMRYEFGNGFSVHGGLRAQKVSGEILSGDGILDASSSFQFGGVAGVAYEIPKIAARIAFTYNSAITQDLTGTHNLLPTTGSVRIPESFNLDLQTGIAKDTLLFGSVRHVKWAGTTLSTSMGGVTTDWVEFVDDSTTYEIGIGRKLNDRWSIAATFGYEEGATSGTTFLAPTGTSKSYGIGASYAGDGYKISAGVKHISFDEKSVNGVVFSGDALAGGMSLDFTF